jgi:O-antigen/teichoic acid export membrane protein
MLGRLVRQGGAYAIAGALLKAAGLVLAPILLNPDFLTVQDYGRFALLMITAQLAVYVGGLGQATALLRFMTREDPGARRDSLPATALAISVGASILVGGIFWVFAAPLARALTDSGQNAALMLPLAAYVGAKCMASIPLTLLRVRERAGLYTVAVVMEMLVLIVVVYAELVGGGSGLSGLVRAYAISAAAGLLALLLLTGSSFRWQVDRKSAAMLLRFGVPLVLASLAGWFLNAGDRYLLKWLADAEAVASYEWSARLAGLINMLLVQSFQLAFTVVGLKAIEAGAEGFYRRTLRHFSIWTGAAILVLSIWTPDGMRVLIRFFDVDAHYLQASSLVFPLALGFGAYGVYIIVNNALLSSGRTGVIGANIVGVAVLNGLLNVALIPVIGAMGAAIATTLSYAVLAAVAAWTSRKDFSVRYQWRIPFTVAALLLGLFAAGTAADQLAPGLRLVAKLAITGAYFAAVPVLRLYTVAEMRGTLLSILAFLQNTHKK